MIAVSKSQLGETLLYRNSIVPKDPNNASVTSTLRSESICCRRRLLLAGWAEELLLLLLLASLHQPQDHATSSSHNCVESTHVKVHSRSALVSFECVRRGYMITCRPNAGLLDSNTNMILIARCFLQSHRRLCGSCDKLTTAWLHMRIDAQHSRSRLKCCGHNANQPSHKNAYT